MKTKKILNKGITLISVVVTIAILTILTGIVVTNVYTGSDYKKYAFMCEDVELLEDKILLYYNRYGELPIKDEVSNIPAQINNGHTFYEINVSKLNNLTLNYGSKSDIFIIDSETFEVYYKDGIQYNGKIYYTD